MSDRVSSFLGGSPLAVLVRLVLLSLAVGVILSWLDWTPFEVVDWIVRFFEQLWNGLFGTFDRAIDYFLLGAAIVVPLFIISRLLKVGRNRY